MAEYGISPSSFGGSTNTGVSPDINSLMGTSGGGKDKSMDPQQMMEMLNKTQMAKGSSGAGTPPGGNVARPPGAAGGSPGMPGFGPPSFGNLIDRLVRYKGTV